MTNETQAHGNLDRNEPKYTVSDVTKMVGISKAKLVDYDNKGILCPARITKGVEQEWRMYSEADLDRLEKIVVLLAYGFKIEEIKRILDEPDVDLTEIVEAKIQQLKREEWRLRNLLLFSKFVDITDTELYEGIIRGPSDIDDFADMVRGSEEYAAAIERINSLTDEELAMAFDELDDIVSDYVSTDPELGFAGVERELKRFLDWWKRNISTSDDLGYLEFWAVFEDDSVVVNEVEEVGGEAAAASLQMSAFYSCMRQLLIDLQDDIRELAELSEKDVVATVSKLRDIAPVICERMGAPYEEGSMSSLGLVASVLSYMQGILQDEELKTYLDSKGAITLDPDKVAQVSKVAEAMRADG